MNATSALGEYVKENKVAIRKISEYTGISYRKLQSSLKVHSTRKLRADEFLKVCFFLKIDPYEFYEETYEHASIRQVV